METIVVLMSTYNGGGYILPQITSILNQKDVKVELYIRDDGSNQDTIEILRGFEKYKNIHIEYGKNIGYQNSFLKLLKNNYIDTKKYYCFSDQDDYWEPEKLINGIRNIGEDEIAALYYTGLKVTDANLNYIETKELNKRHLTLGSAISRSNIPGCTMIFNKYLAKEVIGFNNKSNLKIGHDAWVQLICAAINGKFYYDEKSYINYRRVENSLTNTKKSFFEILNNERKQMFKIPNKSQKISLLLIQNLNQIMDKEDIDLLNQIEKYQLNISNKFNLIKNKQIDTGDKIIDLYSRILILANKY